MVSSVSGSGTEKLLTEEVREGIRLKIKKILSRLFIILVKDVNF